MPAVVASSYHIPNWQARFRRCEREVPNGQTEAYMRERIILLQDMPWWYERFGEIPVLRIGPLRPYWESGLLYKWCQLQYVRQVEGPLQHLEDGHHSLFATGEVCQGDHCECHHWSQGMSCCPEVTLEVTVSEIKYPAKCTPPTVAHDEQTSRNNWALQDAGGLHALIGLGQSMLDHGAEQASSGMLHDSYLLVASMKPRTAPEWGLQCLYWSGGGPAPVRERALRSDGQMQFDRDCKDP